MDIYLEEIRVFQEQSTRLKKPCELSKQTSPMHRTECCGETLQCDPLEYLQGFCGALFKKEPFHPVWKDVVMEMPGNKQS